MKKYLETGKIVGTHGIKGTLRVQCWADSGEFLQNFKYFYLDNEGKEKIEVEKVHTHGTVVLMDITGVSTLEQAEALRGKIIYINRDDTDLPDGRYFIDDLIDCTVIDADTQEKLGKITEVSSTGANDVWHIYLNGKEYLLPAIDEVVISVDIEKKSVIIRPMKGIFDNED